MYPRIRYDFAVTIVDRKGVLVAAREKGTVRIRSMLCRKQRVNCKVNSC